MEPINFSCPFFLILKSESHFESQGTLRTIYSSLSYVLNIVYYVIMYDSNCIYGNQPSHEALTQTRTLDTSHIHFVFKWQNC